MQTRSALIVLLLLSMATATKPCQAQKVDYDARFPAKNREAAKLTTVAILPFRGAEGAAFASALTAELKSSTLDGKNYFTVKTLDGMNYTAPSDPPVRTGRAARRIAAPVQSETAQAMRLGQKLDVSAIYLGEVTSAALTHQSYSQTKQVCTASDNKMKCLSYQPREVKCVKSTVNYSVVPRLISISTGQVVYSSTKTVKDDLDICDGQVVFKGTVGDAFHNIGKALSTMFSRTHKQNPNEPDAEPKPVTTDDELISKVRSDAAQAVRFDVSPYNFHLTVEFKQKAPELTPADQAKFKAADEFAKAKRLDRACSDWESLNTPANAGSVNLLFNLGICQEILVPEDPASALAFLGKADSLTTKPDLLLNKALERVRKMTDSQTEITRQLAPR